DDHHRHPRRAEGGAAVDPRRRPWRGGQPDADDLPPRPAAGDARHPDRHHPGPCPRPWRKRPPAADRHGGLRQGLPRRPAAGLHAARLGPAGAGLPMDPAGRPGLRRAGLGGDHRPPGLPDRHERHRNPPPPPVRTPLVSQDRQMDMNAMQTPVIDTAVLKPRIAASGVQVYYDPNHALKDVSVDILDRTTTAFIGPSGCGKSTFLRCLNRMNDTVASARVEGKILLDGQDIYDRRVDPVQLRARVGMVFQKPNPFPKSIYDNVAYGPRIHGLAR